MEGVIPLALSIAPEIARWLFGETAEQTAAAVAQAVQAATGTADPEAALTMLQRDPAAATQLRLQLAQVAAAQAEAAHAANLATLTTVVQDAIDLRDQPGALSSQRAATAWAAPIVSGLVLVTFGAVMTLVLTSGVPAESATVANMLMGTLAAMATSVVSYWVGSSAGSARKEERLAQTARQTSDPGLSPEAAGYNSRQSVSPKSA